MSMRYKGGRISATHPTTSQSAASGVWTLEQQLQANAALAWPININTCIEDVFSTYLYTGNASSQTITNSIAIGSAYGGSVYFNGSSGYTSVANNAAFDFGSGNFTIEFWLNPIAALAINKGIVVKRASGAFAPFMLVSDGTTPGIVRFLASTSGSAWEINATSSTAVTLSAWNHIAVVRNGTTFTLYLNGTSVGSATASGALMTNTSPVYIGYDPGYVTTGHIPQSYISNLRIVKGTAVYTANFTPPTAPLAAITNTSLLTCQSPSPITDYSTNAFTVTVTNAVAQNGGGPFSDSTANKGGMVWIKSSSGARNNRIFDTNRGVTQVLTVNSTGAQGSDPSSLIQFTTNGFTIGSDSDVNLNAATFASWTFRKQEKFFDVVTYTGNGASNRGIPHNLGSTPGFILVKATSTTGDWYALHRVGNAGSWGVGTLNTTAAFTAPSPSFWGNGTTFTAPTSTTFTVSADGGSLTNGNGVSFVAYLFAHNAGGFGISGTDNVISCGSFVGTSNAVITLGYEPQFLLFKRINTIENWRLVDNMRGWPVSGNPLELNPNLSQAETSNGGVNITATGFTTVLGTGDTYIYIAVRRGPMRTPTKGTSVFTPVTRTGTGTVPWVASGAGFPPDMTIMAGRNLSSFSTPASYNLSWIDRVRRATEHIQSTDSATEGGGWGAGHIHNMDGYNGAYTSDSNYYNTSIGTYVDLHFRRARGFFDVVCYTGTGGSATISHNLGVAPEMVIIKGRTVVSNWETYLSVLGGTAGNALAINSTAAKSGTPPVSSGSATTFTLNSGVSTASGQTYVAYLFATLTNVSKVGSYVGTGTTNQIDCGFTTGARFVLIKRTDNTGDWYVWDSARGIVSGNDPYILLNSGGTAEVTNTDYIDPYNAGFEISSTAPVAINANNGTFIFLAIA